MLSKPSLSLTTEHTSDSTKIKRVEDDDKIDDESDIEGVEDESDAGSISWGPSSRSVSRSRSLECTSVVVSIVDSEETSSKGKTHIQYVIEVQGLKTWTVKRRYTDFSFLDSTLRRYRD